MSEYYVVSDTRQQQIYLFLLFYMLGVSTLGMLMQNQNIDHIRHFMLVFKFAKSSAAAAAADKDEDEDEDRDSKFRCINFVYCTWTLLQFLGHLGINQSGPLKAARTLSPTEKP